MKTLKFLKLTFALCLFLAMVSFTQADKEHERINRSIDVLRDFSAMKESIPHQLLASYNGIVIIPHMLNAGFAIGGKHGRGIALVRLPDGTWSDPVFIELTGGSFGFQIGVQSVDLVLVFRHSGALSQVKNGDFTIGGDISATAGPVGRSSTASTDYKMEAEVYSYSRSRGLFAGISINGSNLGIDKKADAAYYGDNVAARDIFAAQHSTTEAVLNLKKTLKEMAQ